MAEDSYTGADPASNTVGIRRSNGEAVRMYDSVLTNLMR